MSAYHLSAQPIRRAAGRSTTAAAAYRSAVEIVDERTGEIHDYTKKGGVLHSAVLLPGGGTMDRAELWNAIEAHHKRGDAVLAREIVIALPRELSDAERQELAVGFASELADRYGVAADVALHAPRTVTDKDLEKNPGQYYEIDPDAGRRHNGNWHAHIMLSACLVSADGILGKKCVKLDPIHCQRAKIENAVERERVRWCDLVNEALKRAGESARVDHRSLDAQGITDRPPGTHKGPAVSGIVGRGEPSTVAERMKRQADEFMARVQADVIIEQAQAKNIEEMEKDLAQLIAERERPTRTRSVEEIGLQLKPLEGKVKDAKSTLFNAAQARPRALEKVKVEEAIAKSQASKKRLQVLEKKGADLGTELDSTPWWRPLKKLKLEKTIPKVLEELESIKKQAEKFQDIATRPAVENIDAAELAARQVIDWAQPTIAELQNELEAAARTRAELEAAAAAKGQELARLRELKRAAEYARQVAELEASPSFKAEKKARARAIEIEQERKEAGRTRGPSR